MAALNLVIGAKVTESVEQCKKDIQEIVARLDKEPPKIKVQFDYDKEELKKLQEAATAISKTTSSTGGNSSGMRKVAEGAKKAKTETAELAAQISKVNAALKEMQATDSTINSAYRQIKNYLGGENGNAESAASLEPLKAKYLELRAAVEDLRQAKKTATQEDIQGVYDLQAEMQKLLAPIQERMAAEKEAARVAAETAKKEIAAAEAARKASEKAAEAEEKARIKAEAAAEKARAKAEAEATRIMVNASLKEMEATGGSIKASYAQVKQYLGAAELEPIKAKYIELNEAVARLRKTSAATAQEDIQNVQRLRSEMQELLAPIQERIAIEAQAAAEAKDVPLAVWDKAAKQYSDSLGRANSALAKYTAAQNSSNEASRIAYQNIQDCVNTASAYTVGTKGNAKALDELRAKTAEVNRILSANVRTIQDNGDATKTFSERMSGLAQKFSAWLSVSQLIMLAVRSVRKMISASIELDDALTQMQVVTHANADEMERFADSAANAAKKVGSSISDFVDSATTYARLGYDMDESSLLAQYTAMLQNVGDIDVKDAQDAITSIIKAFDDVDASDIESVMDKLITTGNGFPISVAQIAEGMNNASSALAAADNSFDESVALLTAANTTMQDAAKSSTGLRTIAARIRNTKTELDDLGETMTTAQYEELVGMLTKYNVALTDANNEYRSTYDIMSDIAKQWSSMTSMEQAALATAMSGKLLCPYVQKCA